MEEPKACIDLLFDLLVPVKPSHQGEENVANFFTNLLKDNLSRFIRGTQKLTQLKLENLKSEFEFIFTTENEHVITWDMLTNPYYIELEKDMDVKWLYVIWNLVLLHRLARSIEVSLKAYNSNFQQADDSETVKSGAPSMSPDTLSFTEQKTVTRSIQFIVCLGILPYLQPGVGVPFERRSEFKLLQKDLSVCGELTQEEQEWRLMVCSKCLAKWSEIPTMGTLIISRHLGDLLASLLQLVCSSTLKKKQLKVAEQKVSDVRSEMSSSKQRLTHEDIQKCELLLKGLLDKVYPPTLVQELLILQGGAPAVPGKVGVMVRSPAWLRGVCGRILSDILVKPNGVKFVLRGMLGPCSDSAGGSIPELDWKKCDAVSKIIAHCPRKSTCVEEYYKLIAPQVIELLQEEGNELGKQFLRVAVGTITAMLTQHPDITKKHVLTPLLGALYHCIEFKGDPSCKEGSVVVSEETMVTTLRSAYKLFAVGMEPQSILLSYLHHIIHVLFRLYTAVHAGVSYLKSQVEELLLCYLKQSSSHTCVQVFKLFVFEDVCKVKTVSVMKSSLIFLPASHGGIQVIHSTRPEDWESRISCAVELMVKIKNDQVTAEIFIDLLTELTSLITLELETNQSEKLPHKSSLLELDHGEDRLISNVIMLSLLASMCDKLGESCFKRTAHILEFVKVTLERCVMLLKNTDDELTSLFGSETVTMAMGLLTAVMGGASQVSASDREKTKELLPLLQTLSEEHEDETVKEMATDLRIAIATHGFVLSEALKGSLLKDKSRPTPQPDYKQKASKTVEKTGHNTTTNTAEKCSSKEESEPAKKPLIEVLSSTVFEECEQSSSTCNQSASTETLQTVYSEEDVIQRSEKDYRENYKPGSTEPHSTSSLQQAFQELLDPLVPVRGHALISLKRLLEQKDPEALEKQETLVKIFHENLDHSDTYIYLAAIQGLAVLTNRLPDHILPLLADEYVNFDRLKANDKSKEKVMERSPELRMKLGEVLMKCIRDLGDTAPKYRDLVLRSLLYGTKDKDCLVRASSLSNLAEICRLLKFSLGNVIYEILECVSSLIKSEQELEVKRAAVVVLSSILQGLGPHALKVLDRALRDLYHLLKHVERTETDAVLLTHTDRGLEVLDKFMKDFLFPEQTLTKKISVLDPPGQS